MKQARFQDLAKLLTQEQTPRVWSLLITIFGELAQDRDAQISAALLGKLTALIEIKPEAMRVALHRLRKDGWIDSERQGRTSTYSLTDWGRSQSAQATPRIYGLQEAPQQAFLAVFDPGQPVPDPAAEGAWIASNILVTASPESHPEALVSEIPRDVPLPDWIGEKICSPDLMRLTQGFHAHLIRLRELMKHAEPLDCFEIAAMRILLVDRWRRIILRTPALPTYVFGPDWPGDTCRTHVAELLGQCQRQSLDDLVKRL